MGQQEQSIPTEAAKLAVIEIGLGSVLHSARVPFAGHVLSLIQGALLAGAVRTAPSPFAPCAISNIAAVLKSLSPAGKRLTPMLAISAQGLLFNLGTLLLGPGLAGSLTGMTLLCLWGFLQPILIYYLLFGEALVDGLEVLLLQIQKMSSASPQILLGVVLGVVLVKVLCGWAVCMYVFRGKLTWLDRLAAQAGSVQPLPQPPTGTLADRARGAARSLRHPLFLLSFALTATVFAFSESPASERIWILLRPLGASFALFFLFQCIPFDRLVGIKEGRLAGFAQALRSALALLNSASDRAPSEGGPPR